MRNTTYYRIWDLTEREVSGVDYSQIKGMSDETWKWMKEMIISQKHIPPDPLHSTLNVYSKAKLTNALSLQALRYNKGFVINSRLKELLSIFKLPGHYYYAIKLAYRRQIIEDYSLLQLVPSFNGKEIVEYINVPESDFYLGMQDGEFISKIAPVSIKEIIQLQKTMNDETMDRIQRKEDLKLEFINCRKFCLDKSLNELDLIPITFYDGLLYASERLINTLIDNKITGFSIAKESTSRICFV